MICFQQIFRDKYIIDKIRNANDCKIEKRVTGNDANIWRVRNDLASSIFRFFLLSLYTREKQRRFALLRARVLNEFYGNKSFFFFCGNGNLPFLFEYPLPSSYWSLLFVIFISSGHTHSTLQYFETFFDSLEWFLWISTSHRLTSIFYEQNETNVLLVIFFFSLN